MVLASGTSLKSKERRVKKASENSSAKTASIFGSCALPEGERSRKDCPKEPRGVPKGSPREAETAKHGSQEGLEISPVSEVCPEMLGWPPETPFGRISAPFWFNFRMIFDSCFLTMPCATFKKRLRQGRHSYTQASSL